MTGRKLDEVLRAVQESGFADLHCAIPGTIHTYDNTTQFATVQPVVKRPIASVSEGVAFEELPILEGVKICFAYGGAITTTLTKGDGVMVVCSDYDASQWLGTANPGAAGQTRTHSLGFGFAIAGISALPIAHAALPALVLEHTDIRLGAAAAPSDIVVTASKLITAINASATGTQDGGATFKSNLVTQIGLLTGKVTSE